MRALLVIPLLALLGVTVGDAAPQTHALPATLEGTYAATGSSPAGTYTARTDLIAHGPVYEVRWTFPQGDGMVGVGFAEGDRLVVGFAVGGPGGAPVAGVGVYRVVAQAPLTLEAQWTSWGFTTLERERLVKGPPAIRAAR